MAKLTIQLLGQFQVVRGEKQISDFASDKVRALLAYLIAEAQYPHRREILADLLWPEKPEKSARGNLRRALANLRQAVNDKDAISSVMLITRKDIQFNLDSDSWVDVHRLNQIYDLKEITPEHLNQFGKILDIYKGEFLAGFSLKNNLPFEEWVIMMREQYTRKAIMILNKATNYYENSGDYQSALPFAWRHVELEPWQEGARRHLMRLLARTGRRDEALHQFEVLRNTLQYELGISPEPKTLKLFEQIRDGENIPLEKENDGKVAVRLPVFFHDDDVNAHVESDVFVARAEEIKTLNKSLKDVLSGRGDIALIGGEAGAGKSTLIREFIRKAQLRHPDLVSATGYCNAFTGSGDPYLPFREILYQFSGDIETHWTAGAFTREYALHLSRIVPLTCDALINHGPDLIDRVIPGNSLLANAKLFSPEKSDWFQNLKKFVEQRQASQSGGIQQANLLSQFTVVLKEIANQYPVVIVIDDLQWADEGTLSMLFHLGKNLAGSKIMLLGAFRTEEVGLLKGDQRHPLIPILNEFKRDFGEIIINLDRISGADFIHELIASEPNELGEDFRENLLRLTQGHALFTVELLRALQDSGTLYKGADGRWKAKSDLSVEAMPARIEGIIAERLGKLPQKLLNLLSLASVEGEFFVSEVIADAGNQPTNDMSYLMSEVLDKQHRLVQAHQIQVENGKTISTYRFRHILFQKFLYSRLDEIEQVRYHDQIGKALENIAGENKDKYAVQLARHFYFGKQFAKAFTYYILAGERAFQMAGFPEAIKHYERALELLYSLPETPSRNEQELELQLQLGIAVQNIKGYAHERVGQAFMRAWELCQIVGDTSKIISTQQLLFSYYANMAEYDIAFDILAFLAEIYDPGDATHALHKYWGNGYMDYMLGKQGDCWENFEKASSLYDPDVHEIISKKIGMEAGIYCNGWAGLLSVWVGYPDKAENYRQTAMDIAKRYSYSQFTAEALWFSAWICLELNDNLRGKEYVERLLEITTKEHYFLYESVARAFLGRVLAWEGRYGEAIESIQLGYQMFQMTGMITARSIFHYAFAEVYCGAGQIQEGLEVVAQSEKFEREVGERIYSTAIAKIKGDLLAQKGDEVAAEEAYQLSIQMAQAESAKMLELEAVKGLALLWESQGKNEQAKKKLQEVYDWFTEGVASPKLIEAKKILDNLGA